MIHVHKQERVRRYVTRSNLVCSSWSWRHRMALEACHLAFGVQGLRQPRRPALTHIWKIYYFFLFSPGEKLFKMLYIKVLSTQHITRWRLSALHDVILRLRKTKPSSVVLSSKTNTTTCHSGHEHNFKSVFCRKDIITVCAKASHFFRDWSARRSSITSSRGRLPVSCSETRLHG